MVMCQLYHFKFLFFTPLPLKTLNFYHFDVPFIFRIPNLLIFDFLRAIQVLGSYHY